MDVLKWNVLDKIFIKKSFLGLALMPMVIYARPNIKYTLI